MQKGNTLISVQGLQKEFFADRIGVVLHSLQQEGVLRGVFFTYDQVWEFLQKLMDKTANDKQWYVGGFYKDYCDAISASPLSISHKNVLFCAMDIVVQCLVGTDQNFDLFQESLMEYRLRFSVSQPVK